MVGLLSDCGCPQGQMCICGNRAKPWDALALPTPDHNPPRVVRTCFSSDGTSLDFRSLQEWRQYQRDIRQAEMVAYDRSRSAYGIPAGGADDTVQTREEHVARQWSGKPSIMEQRWDQWVAHGKQWPIQLVED